MKTFQRIVSDPTVLKGKPRIRGTRISIEFILELMASGASGSEILTIYPHLTHEDLTEALEYAAYNLRNELILDAELVA